MVFKESQGSKSVYCKHSIVIHSISNTKEKQTGYKWTHIGKQGEGKGGGRGRGRGRERGRERGGRKGKVRLRKNVSANTM